MNNQNSTPWAGIIVWILIIGGIIWANSTYTKSLTETVPCRHYTVQSNSLYEGESRISQYCVNGKKTITTTYRHWDNSQKGEPITTTLIAAKDEVRMVGSAKKPVIPTYKAPASGGGGRTGAVCRDGWNSSATGSGACSHHGGVAYWTY